MNGELDIIVELMTLNEKLEEEIKSLKEEYNRLVDISSEITETSLIRIKEIREELVSKNNKIQELELDINSVVKKEEEITNLEDIIAESYDKAAKYLVGKELKSLKEEKALLESNLYSKYYEIEETVEKEDNEEKEEIFEEVEKNIEKNIEEEFSEEDEEEKVVTEEMTEEKTPEEKVNNKFFTKKRKISIIALLLAAGIGFGFFSSCSKDKNKNKDINETSISDNAEDLMNSIKNNQIQIEIPTNSETDEFKFIDINDEEQVSVRSNEIMNDLNTNVKGHDYSIEEIENIMKWVNNGVVEDPSQAAALFTELRVENLWNKENQEEVSVAFDTSKLFKDGSQGQKLAKKIYDIRVKLMNAENEEEYRKYAEEFAVLLVNSWYLNGSNNEISVFVLETNFSKALLDGYFLNTYAMIHAENIVVTVNDNEFNLDAVANEIDEAVCTDTLFNKFTSDMIGAEEEATRTKENSHTLTK